MAWVPAELAREGAEFFVTMDDGFDKAHVRLKPFFDPEGDASPLVTEVLDFLSPRQGDPRGRLALAARARAARGAPGGLRRLAHGETRRPRRRGLAQEPRARDRPPDAGARPRPLRLHEDGGDQGEAVRALLRRRPERRARRPAGAGRDAHAPAHRARPGRAPGRGRRRARPGVRDPRTAARPSASSSRRNTGTTWPKSSSTRPKGYYQMKDVFRVRRMWRPRGELKRRYDVVIVGGGSHGLATAYYLAKNHGIKNVAVLDKSYIGSGAAGRNTTIIRANYRTPEGAAFYSQSVKLYEGLGGRARLQPALLPAGPPDARPLRPRDHHRQRARRGEQAPRDRQPRHLPGRDQQALPRDEPLDRRHLARDGGPLSPAGRDHPPRRRRLGLRARRRPAGRRDPPVHGGDWDRSLATGRVTASRPRAATSSATRSSAARPAGRPWWPTSRGSPSRSRRTSSRPSSPSR